MRTLVPLSLALALCACSGASPAPGPTAPAARVTSAPPAPPPALPDHALARSAVHDVVSQGLGTFLQRVTVDDQPVFAGGKFHGFRIAALRADPFWTGVDLKAGDVVTAVNGFPIERPEQAQTAFDSLEVASELRVAYERDGQTRELVYAIVDGR
ncbi:MAG TPA: serine protease [Polyangiaceae bacterium]|jgi:type II secretory pathway component PulC